MEGLHVTGLWFIAAVFAYFNVKRIPISAWYVLPFGIIFSAFAVRILDKIAQAKKCSQAEAALKFQRWCRCQSSYV
jgi:hypothetical protein